MLDRDDLDLYDRPIGVEFAHRIRGQERFADVSALVDRMAVDVSEARALLARVPDEADRLRGTERWFYRRGLPFFVEDYQSSTDVWTRASPFLAVIFVVLVIVAR